MPLPPTPHKKPTDSIRGSARLQLPLTLLLILTVAAAFLVPSASSSFALADESTPVGDESSGDESTGGGGGDDTALVDQGDLAFLYTGDSMADPDRRDFPIQPDYAPDLPFTITDLIAVTDDLTDPPILGYIWHVKNASIDTTAENILFAFGSYAVTRSAYVDVLVKANAPGEFKLDAKLYVIDNNSTTPGRLNVRETKTGKTKVNVEDDGPPAPEGDSVGFVRTMANPAIIGVGEETTFTAELLEPDRTTHDNTSGVTVFLNAPVTLGPQPTVDGLASFAGETFDEANLYPVTSTATGYTPDIPASLAVVEVASLTPNRGTHHIEELPSGSVLDIWYVVVDDVDNTVVVKAQSNPAIRDEDLPGSWSLRVEEHGETVPHDGSAPEDTRSQVTVGLEVDQVVRVYASCGTSELVVLIQGVSEMGWLPLTGVQILITDPHESEMSGDPEAHYLPINHEHNLKATASDIDEYRINGAGSWHQWDDDVTSGETEDDYHIVWTRNGPGRLEDMFGPDALYFAPQAYMVAGGDLQEVEITATASDMHLRDGEETGAADEDDASDTVTISIWQVTLRARQEGRLTSENDIDLEDETNAEFLSGHGYPFLGLTQPSPATNIPGYFGVTEIVGDIPLGPELPEVLFKWQAWLKGDWYIEFVGGNKQRAAGFPADDWQNDGVGFVVSDFADTDVIHEGEDKRMVFMIDAPGWEGCGVDNNNGINSGAIRVAWDIEYKNQLFFGGKLVSNAVAWDVEFVLESDDMGTPDDPEDDQWLLQSGHTPNLAVRENEGE